MTQLEEYVLTYKDATGRVVCNMEDYYSRYVTIIDPKFTHFHLGVNQMAICPLHDDHDPSLGLIRDRHHKDVYIYHCFGCGKTGSVIRFHQYIQNKYYKKELSIKECCLELCKLFGIPEPDLSNLADDDYEAIYKNKCKKVDSFGYKYSSSDLHRELLDIRKQGVSLDKINMACVKRIATVKELYD